MVLEEGVTKEEYLVSQEENTRLERARSPYAGPTIAHVPSTDGELPDGLGSTTPADDINNLDAQVITAGRTGDALDSISTPHSPYIPIHPVLLLDPVTEPPPPPATHALPPAGPKRRIRELRLDLRTLDAAALFTLETWRREVLRLEKLDMEFPDSVWYKHPPSPIRSPVSAKKQSRVGKGKAVTTEASLEIASDVDVASKTGVMDHGPDTSAHEKQDAHGEVDGALGEDTILQALDILAAIGGAEILATTATVDDPGVGKSPVLAILEDTVAEGEAGPSRLSRPPSPLLDKSVSVDREDQLDPDFVMLLDDPNGDDASAGPSEPRELARKRGRLRISARSEGSGLPRKRGRPPKASNGHPRQSLPESLAGASTSPSPTAKGSPRVRFVNLAGSSPPTAFETKPPVPTRTHDAKKLPGDIGELGPSLFAEPLIQPPIMKKRRKTVEVVIPARKTRRKRDSHTSAIRQERDQRDAGVGDYREEAVTLPASGNHVDGEAEEEEEDDEWASLKRF